MTGFDPMRDIAHALDEARHSHRERRLSLPGGIDFTSNDYLGLSRHPAIRNAMIAALQREGVAGSGGSRLLRGHYAAHAELEDFAAQFFRAPKALYFSSGFAANFSLFTTLPTRHDAVVFDERIHASVKEGLHASPAARYRARHNDAQSFETEIRRARDRNAQNVFVAVESVYSMDGDLAPLGDLAAIARRLDAILVVDEAHATGVFGAQGRGLSEGLDAPNAILLHTSGKALGVSGALVCASETVVDYLVNRARPFIYSTAPPPHLAAGVKRALQLVNEEPWRRARVLELAALAHRLLTKHEPARFPGSPIIPVILGEDERAVKIADAVRQKGFDVRAIRPPTVAEGTARLRVAIHADHSEDDIRGLADAVAKALAA